MAQAKRSGTINILPNTPGPRGDTCPPCPPGEKGETGDKGLPGHPGQYTFRTEDGNAIIPGRGCLYLEDLGLRPNWEAIAMYSGRFFSIQYQLAEGGTGAFDYEMLDRPSWLNWNANYRIMSGMVPNSIGTMVRVRYKATDRYTGETIENPLTFEIFDGAASQTGGTDDRYYFDGEIPRFYVLAGQSFNFTVPPPIFIGFGSNENPNRNNALAVEFATSTSSRSFGRNVALDAGASAVERNRSMVFSGTAPTIAQINALGRPDRPPNFLRQDFHVYVTGHRARNLYQFTGTIFVIDPISLVDESEPKTVQRSRTGDLSPVRPRDISVVVGGERSPGGAIETSVTKVPVGSDLESICTNSNRRIQFDNTSQPEPGTYPYTLEVLDPRIANTSINNSAMGEYEFTIPERN